MTRRDTIKSVHEPFGDAFYYGPERLSTRFEHDIQAREKSGFSKSTYKTIFDQIDEDNSEGKRVFIKDIIHYLVPPDGKSPSIAPSLGGKKKGVGTNGLTNGYTNGLTNGTTNGHTNGNTNGNTNGHINGYTNGHTNGHTKTNSQTNICGEVFDESQTPYPFDTYAEPNNPTVVPTALLEKFHFTFLIRDPHSSIPSYFRCTIPPLDDKTGFYHFDPQEAGYDEVRRVFEYLHSIGQVGPHNANGWNSNANRSSINGQPAGAEICVVDADDLLDDPEGIIKAYCISVGLPFEPEMLEWADEKHQEYAKKTFEKWPGFHEDAIDSTDLKPRAHKKKPKTEEQWDAEWVERYGEEAAKTIRETVDRNMEDYLYMRQFVLKAKA